MVEWCTVDSSLVRDGTIAMSGVRFLDKWRNEGIRVIHEVAM